MQRINLEPVTDRVILIECTLKLGERYRSKSGASKHLIKERRKCLKNGNTLGYMFYDKLGNFLEKEVPDWKLPFWIGILDRIFKVSKRK